MYKLPVNYCFLIPTTILLFLLPYFSQAQNTKGTVLDANTKLPVAFASIYQLKTTKGTITNSNGEFNIPISNKGEIEIRISCIGYKTLFQKLTFNKNKVVIFLTPDEASLQEVVVMPDSLLKTILKKSYQNISSNYAQSPMELTGFYREVQKSTTDDHFLYFGEALLKVQQKGYNHPNEDAQIEILKSRIINFPHSDSIDNVKYYRGPFIPQWGDFVRNRSNFLNPNSFNKTYIYHLDAITTYNNKEDSVYVIRFSSKKPSDKKSGKIWINKKTFAYLKIEFNNQTHEKRVHCKLSFNFVIYILLTMTREELHKLIDCEYDKLESMPLGHTLYDLEVRVEMIKQKVGQALLQSQTGACNDRRKKKDTDTQRGD